MKSRLINCLTIILGFSLILTGCSTNTRNENIALGVAAGAVTGGLAGSVIGSGTGAVLAGAAAGAIVGGVIGSSIDTSDQAKINYIFNNNPPKKATSWTNERTGICFTVAPTSKVYCHQNHPICRKYRCVAKMGAKTRHVRGIACRTEDGNWQSVDR